ncbi:ComEA family DNA-binding protein [Isoptericola sp. NPDC057559]|uniref:ComEA family DNA-binding protein n=1 Tax=Isoptericola sp. NPDC057559 TaxID=3346168 RepID=UPI00368C6D74
MTSTLPHHTDGAAPLGPDAAGRHDGPSDGARPDARAASPLDEAAARLAAWHAVRGPAAAGAGDGPGADPWDHGGDLGGPPGPERDDEDELAARLRARRSARHVAAAYAAAHGHAQLDDHADHDGGRPRWSLGLRAAVVASVAVLLVAVAVAVVATLRPGEVVTLAGAGDAGSAGAASAAASPAASAPDPPATPGPAGHGEVTPGQDGDAEGAAGPGPGTVVVHVVGEVREPGLVTVPVGARVADAVAAAGGTTKRADPAALNLARAVVDGEQIRVPRPGEQPEAEGGGTSDADPGAGGADGGGLVPLNSAGAAELEELPGIGPALAGRIVQWRDEHGPFTSVDELDEVSGIGPSVLGQVRDLVRL